jgi:UDP-GlcNAc:undecaprenyl-phosphate GlcNAc-1-phosphate transferase
VTLTDRVELPVAVAVPLTVLFLVGITNAINLADGLDGLAGGTTLLSCCAIALLGLTIGDRFVTTVAIVASGSILGFLRYNTYPARIFMGDGGSQFLGFTVAVIAILLTQGASGPISAALPLLLLGVPILDTLMVMAQRMIEGRSPFAADKNHVHHRLLALGFDHHEAVIVIYLLQAGLFLTAWYMRYESDLKILALFGSYALVVLGCLIGASRLGWRWRRPVPGPATVDLIDDRRRGLQFIRRRLPGWALLGVGSGAAAYSLHIALTASPVSTDVGWLALLLSGVLLVTGLASLLRSAPIWLLHGALYVCAVVMVYLDVTASSPESPMKVESMTMGLLAGSVALYFRLTTVRRFRLTPLDYLLIFVAVALPNLPGSFATPRELGFGVVKVLVLFYAIEMLLGHSNASRNASHALAAVTLGLLAYRALA